MVYAAESATASRNGEGAAPLPPRDIELFLTEAEIEQGARMHLEKAEQREQAAHNEQSVFIHMLGAEAVIASAATDNVELRARVASNLVSTIDVHTPEYSDKAERVAAATDELVSSLSKIGHDRIQAEVERQVSDIKQGKASAEYKLSAVSRVRQRSFSDLNLAFGTLEEKYMDVDPEHAEEIRRLRALVGMVNIELAQAERMEPAAALPEPAGVDEPVPTVERIEKMMEGSAPSPARGIRGLGTFLIKGFGGSR